jgi:hypothetical protein
MRRMSILNKNSPKLDPAVLRTIDPKTIEQHLIFQKWKLVSTRTRSSRHFAKGERYILLPMKQTLADYPVRIAQIILELKKDCDLSEKEIMRSLFHPPKEMIVRSKPTAKESPLAGLKPLYNPAFDRVKRPQKSLLSKITQDLNFSDFLNKPLD